MTSNGYKPIYQWMQVAWESGVQWSWHLLPFLPSATSTLSFQKLILPSRTASIPDIDVRDASSSWTIFSGVSEPPDEIWHVQKYGIVQSSTTNWLKFSTFLGCWESPDPISIVSSLQRLAYGPSMTSIRSRLSVEMIRIAVGFRLGLRTCEPHTCPCGKEINIRGLHELSCRRSSDRQQWHAKLNDSIWRSIKMESSTHLQTTSRFVKNRRETSRRSHTHLMITW